jgi:hypothetical protein
MFELKSIFLFKILCYWPKEKEVYAGISLYLPNQVILIITVITLVNGNLRTHVNH